jgi:hypothetical protein
MTIRERYWAWVNRRQAAQIERGALAADRFVLYISVYGRRLPIRFVPREDEAPAFFGQFVIPWAFGTGGVFSHQGPYHSPGSPVADRAPHIEVLRHRDIIAVEIIAPDDAYRDRLDQVLKRLVGETRAAMEAEQVAQQVAHFTRTMQATVEAHRALERRGDQDPKGTG